MGVQASFERNLVAVRTEQQSDLSRGILSSEGQSESDSKG